MKGRLHTLRFALVTVLAAGAVVSCHKDKGGGVPRAGDPVRLSIRSSWLPTRTSYSGEIDANGVERIDWMDGDRFTLACAACGDPTTADYRISGASIKPDGSHSEAYAGAVTLNGLTWGSGVHHFYAIYPSPAMMDKEDQARVSVNTYGLASAYIPASQTLTKGKTSEVDGKVLLPLLPDMRYSYMWAARATTPIDELALYFTPMVTVFRFSVTGDGSGEEATIESFELSSTSCALSGGFTAQITADGTSAAFTVPEYVDKGDDANNSIRIVMPEGVAVGSDKRVEFALFVFPASAREGKTATIGDLTIRFNTDLGTRSLALRHTAAEGGAFYEFPAGRKIHINNLTLPIQVNPWSFSVLEVEDLDPRLGNAGLSDIDMQDMGDTNASTGIGVNVEDPGNSNGSTGTGVNVEDPSEGNGSTGTGVNVEDPDEGNGSTGTGVNVEDLEEGEETDLG